MKKLYKYLILLLATAVLSCDSNEFGPIGEPFDKLGNINGTYKLVSVIQTDEDAVSKGFPAFVQTLDITDQFLFNEYVLTLNLNENGKPDSFIEQAGGAPALIGFESGSWAVDDEELPSQITFSSGDESVAWEIGTYLGLAEGKLTLKLTRMANGKPFLSYDYQFEKQQ